MRKLMIAAVVLGSIGLASAAEPKRVKLADVPRELVVAAAFVAESVEEFSYAVPSPRPDGKMAYQIVGKTKGGKTVLVQATPDNKIAHVRVEIAMKDVPEAVRKALAGKRPNFKATWVTTMGPTDDPEKV